MAFTFVKLAGATCEKQIMMEKYIGFEIYRLRNISAHKYIGSEIYWLRKIFIRNILVNQTSEKQMRKTSVSG